MTDKFPRTMIENISVPRLIIGTNWFLGYSHISKAKDKLIKDYQSEDKIADVLEVFFRNGINAILGPPVPVLINAAKKAEDRTGEKAIMIFTPHFDIIPGGEKEKQAEYMFDLCREYGGQICMPHQSITDAIIDRMTNTIRKWDEYSKMIRDRGMIPGFSTHMPETIIIADKVNADAATYIQIYNPSGFLMQTEVDWAMRIIREAKKPVITIKPLSGGRVLPSVGLAFVWNTIREQDMVTIGTTTPDEAKEVIELSFDFINKRIPDNELQKTRSKKFLT